MRRAGGVRGGEERMNLSLDVAGIRELEELLRCAEGQIADLRRTVGKINTLRMEIEAKINQPPAGTDG